MPEPTIGELPQTKFVTVAETPLYVTKPDGDVTEITLKSASKRGAEGLDNAVLLMRQKSRRRGEDEYLKPLDNLNDLEQVDWDKVGGLRYQDADGEHVITKDQLSLESGSGLRGPQGLTPDAPALSPDAPAARSVLESVAGVPTLTIVGLKAYEVRAHDLADKSMQIKMSPREREHYEGFQEFWEKTKDSLHSLREMKRTIWKHSLGHTYFHEKSRQYYMDMLKSANSPFAAESIKAAEAAGQIRYDDLLKNGDFLTRAGTRFVDYIKSNLGLRSMVQRFALEEIGHMREQNQIKESASFERESAATRKRFEQDFDRQDNFIRKTLGEKLELADEPVASDIRNLVRRYASGEIATKEAFDAEVKTFYETKLKSARPDVFQHAELYSSSLFDVAETLRSRASHDAGLANIDAQLQSMQVRLGMGVMGEATELEPSAVKKGTEVVHKMLTWLEKRDIVFNELTVSSGVALALSLAAIPKSIVSSQARLLGGFAGGIAAGAVFGGIREYRQLQHEYLTHMREREVGLTFSPDAKRRAWMERFYLSQRSSDELIGSLESTSGQNLLANLADAKARKALSSREKQRYGLIQFSGLENIETQRTALDVAVDRAEQALLAGGKVEKQFLDDLTKAQTRVLTEGIEALEGLDNPMKVTLGLLSKYNPEVEIMRRRFPLLGPEYKTGEKATGMEEILKEFRRAALGASVRRGLAVGLSGAVIGAGIREGLQLGVEGANALGVHLFRVSNNLRIDGDTLDVVDPKGNVIREDVVKNLGSHFKYNADGTFSQETRDYILEQGKPLSLKFEFPEAARSQIEFSGATHPLADIASKPIDAPEQLHWVFSDQGRQLMLDAKDGTQHLIYTDGGHPGDPSGALAAIRKSELFEYTAEKPILTDVAPSEFKLTTIASIPYTGGIHTFEATIPAGTELHQTASGVYELARGDETLLSGIHINEFGRITNIPTLADAAAEHGLALDNSETILKVEGESALSGTFDKVAGEMGEEKGFHGPWGWLEDPINADSSIVHHVPGTNLAKNLFRGYEENVVEGSNFVQADGGTLPHGMSAATYTMMQPADVFKDLPNVLFADKQLVKLGTLMDEAIEMREVTGVKLADMDELHRLAYEIGRIGRVATKEEVQMFIDSMSGGVEKSTITVFRPIIEQTITETTPGLITGTNGEIVTNLISLAETPVVPEIPWIPLPLVGRRPLEPYEPLVPYTPPEVPPGAVFPVLPRPGEDRPSPFLTTWFPYGRPLEGQYSQGEGRNGPKYTEEELKEHYRAVMYPELRDNPKAQLDFDRVARWYFEAQSPEYKQSLEALDQTIGTPMHDEARMAVCIPVAAHQEGKTIYHTLEQYQNQTNVDGTPLSKDSYEIILFMNTPEGTTQDGTLDEAKRFMADHPDMPVRIATGQFPKGSVRYGTYIKYAYDLALLRAMKRQNPIQKDILIATGDADLVSMDSRYLASNIAMMNDPGSTNLDAALAGQDLDKRVLDAYPTFKAALRFSQYHEAQGRLGLPGWDTPTAQGPNNPKIPTQGRTTILRGSILAGIGGVNYASPAGADTELGAMIHFARTGKVRDIPADEYRIGYNGETNIQTSARRELATYLSNQPITRTWWKFDEGENVRGKTAEELVAMSTERPGQVNAKELERQINAYREWEVRLDSMYTKRALEWMGLKEGVDYAIEDENPQKPENDPWRKKIVFTGNLDGLKERIDMLPSEPPGLTETPSVEATAKVGMFDAEYINKDEFDVLYKQIFVDNEYPWKPDPSRAEPSIIDLGSHIGLSVMRWKSLAPNANVTAVEANPDTAQILKHNIQRNNLSNITVIEGAASSRDGSIDLYTAKTGVDYHLGDTTQKPPDVNRYEKVSVPSVRVSELISGPVDLLKMDIEGAELDVLKEVGSKLLMVKEVMFEFHHNPTTPQNSLNETVKLLRGYGYELQFTRNGEPVDPGSLDLSQPTLVNILAKRP